MGSRLRVTIATSTLACATGWLSVGAAMQPGLPSKTSVVAASLRAIGAKHPEPPFRNPDSLAHTLLGPRERALLDEFPVEALDLGYEDAVARLTPQDRGSVTSMYLRTRVLDDAMDEGLRGGTRQVIILGAGFDSRGHRFRDRLAGARFIEVDQGPTQSYKRQRVREALGAAADVVRYVAMDFNKDDLLTQLRTVDYSERERSLYIWEGVTMYLPEAAVTSTLRFVRQHAAPGSRIAFDYTSADDPRVNNPTTRFARWGEPWLYGFPGPSAVDTLRKAGLETVLDASYSELATKYTRRPDGTSALPDQSNDQRTRRIAIAQVPSGRR
jgi:methyltransferase (TIGR00027 family)